MRAGGSRFRRRLNRRCPRGVRRHAGAARRIAILRQLLWMSTIEYSFCNSRQCLPRAARDKRDNCALVLRVQRARTECVAHLFGKLAIRAQGVIKFTVNFSHHAIPGIF